VLESVDVHIKIATALVGQLAPRDEFRGGLRWHEMQEVKVLSHCISTGQVGERGHTIGSIDLRQVVLEELFDALVQARLIQRHIVVVLRREHNGWSRIVSNLGAVPDAIFSKRLLTKVEDLLRGPTAFDRKLGASEDGITTLESFSHPASFVGALQRVHGTNRCVSGIKGLLSAFDLVESKLETGVDN